MELTRRHALASAAAIAAAPLLPTMPARAAAPVADKQAPSFYRYKVGDIQVTVVSDGRNGIMAQTPQARTPLRPQMGARHDRVSCGGLFVRFSRCGVRSLVAQPVGPSLLDPGNRLGNRSLPYRDQYALPNHLEGQFGGIFWGRERISVS
jgi:hypothetical protein